MSVTITVEDSLGVVVIDREDKLNALNVSTFVALEHIINSVHHNPQIHSVIVTAAGTRAFSAGADISELSGLGAQEAIERAQYRRGVFHKLSQLSVPTVAVINGYAMGGGVELALACTFRLATARSKFSFPEIKLGLLPGAGGTQRLPRLIGEARALDLMLTARQVDAVEALRIGLIDKIIEDPLSDARLFVEQWSQYGRLAVGAIITAVRAAKRPIEDGFAVESEQLAYLNSTADAAEGIAAFLGKRRPHFKGR